MPKRALSFVQSNLKNIRQSRHDDADLESGSSANLLGPTMSSRVSDVYFPELLSQEKAKCSAASLLHPDAWRYRAWQILIHVLVSWCAIWTPFEFGFMPSPTAAVMYADGALSLLFLLDMALTFCSAFRDPKSLKIVTSRAAIATRYLRRGFFLDVLSSVPYNLISLWATGAPIGGALGTFLRLLGCLRLYRLPRVYHEFSLLGRRSYSTFIVIRLGKLLLNIVLAAHYAAILYFWITTLESDPQSVWIVQALGPEWQTQPILLQYVATMWWSIFVITSIGPAYTSTTTVEQIFSCFYALFGMAALSYTLGTLTLLMVKASSSTMEYHEDMEAVRAFAARNSLPPELAQQLEQQIQLRLLQKKSEVEGFLSNLPQHLKVALMRQLHLPTVERLSEFQGCSKAFLNQMVSACETEVVTRNAIVTLAGDVATHLYIVISGKLVREGSDMELSVLLPGRVFGKTAVLYDVPQLFTVRAAETSQLLRLPKAAFQAILEAYPDDKALILSALDDKFQSNRTSQQGSPDNTSQGAMADEASRVAVNVLTSGRQQLRVQLMPPIDLQP